MLAKRTSKNQLTLPQMAVESIDDAEYYDVTVDNGRVVLTPVRLEQSDEVRAGLAELGIDQKDVDDAVTWARKNK